MFNLNFHFSNLIIGMKVDRERAFTDKSSGQKPLSRAQYVKKSIEDNSQRMGGRRTDFRQKSELLSKM